MEKNKKHNYVVTVDGDLMVATPTPSGMDTLKQWCEQGKIEIIEALRPPKKNMKYNWPGAKDTSPAKGRRATAAARGEKSGAVNFNRIASVLFPYKNPNKLNIQEVNDVAHLLKHYSNKHAVFVTTNTENFIESGKRESLRSIGILTMTPDEVVDYYTSNEGWKAAA